MVLKEGSYFKDTIIVILVIALALALVYNIGIIGKPTIIYLTNQTNIIDQTNIITNQTTLIQNNSFTVPLNPEKEYYQYNINLVIAPNTICVGDTAAGSIRSNIPNGVCSIFTNTGTGFKIYKNVILNSNGYYSETNQMNTAGRIIFRAVCCDLNRNCKISGDAYLSVESCQDSDGDGIPDDEDLDDDNDGWSDEEELENGTDPLDPNSHPGEYGCNADCIAKSYSNGRGPFESASSCDYPEVVEYLTGESGLICCCSPNENVTITETCTDDDNTITYFEDSLTIKSECADSGGQYEDSCEDGMLKEWYCTSQNICRYTLYNCKSYLQSYLK